MFFKLELTNSELTMLSRVVNNQRQNAKYILLDKKLYLDKNPGNFDDKDLLDRELEVIQDLEEEVNELLELNLKIDKLLLDS